MSARNVGAVVLGGLLLFTGFFIGSNAQAATLSSRYENAQERYALSLPEGWLVEESTDLKQVTFRSPGQKLFVMSFVAPVERADKYGAFLLDEITQQDAITLLAAQKESFFAASPNLIAEQTIMDYGVLPSGHIITYTLMTEQSGEKSMMLSLVRGHDNMIIIGRGQTLADFVEGQQTLADILLSFEVQP
ncbi:MAG: hypothetical protein KBF19_06950 [Negativicutes bacterium]|nr:hypothetical protein [Negativicutes bacterium]